ncbi:ABC-2 type transport system permease protein [Lentibacillus halodurans]|uniref:ABC-2 type transport system permease protein n=1 Tax=Lentibacillus halodurans TaxID=237679 RepID=A0A1I0ZZZ3_9BACI|nr:ABC transporter permease [Lentibacillus halodurans]SFB31294.1 ABC-2 type transport system permease protein [Lentibacillus halodurans]
MIWQIMKKQGLTLLRNPVQLLLLVGLPIILIAILGTALAGTMNGEPSAIDVKIAVVEHGDEEEQVNRFMNSIENENALPPEAVEGTQASIDGLMPVRTLKEDVFGNDDLENMVDVHEAAPSEHDELLNDDTYTAVIEVPENFSYDMLEYIVLDKPVQPELKISRNETQEIGGSIVKGIIQQYQEQLTLGTFLSKNGMNMGAVELDEESITGDTTSVDQKSPVTAKAYYAVGMVVMNVLFLASTIGSMAFLEKKIHVFDRVILGNMSRWVYFTGVLLSGMLLSFLHLLIVYGFAWLFFGVSWPDIMAFFTVTLAYAMAVGGIAVLLTAISYRFNSELITNFFSGIIVTIMAFIGGSFFPIGETSEFFRKIGNFTPNGAGMSAYLTILRGDGIPEVWHHVLFLGIFAMVAIILAALSFPKRGMSA